MSFIGSRPVRRLGTYSAGQKREAVRVHDDRDARATARYQTVRYVAALVDSEGASLRTLRARVRDAVRGGLLPLEAPMSHEALRTLYRKWSGGARSVSDYVDAPRCGRPRTVDPRLRDMVQQAVYAQDYGRSVRRLHERLEREAERLGITCPSYETIKRLVRSHGRLAISVARHGTRPAQLDALPHSTVPTQHTHDAWVLDETDAPFFARVFDPQLEQWVSVRPTIISVVDHRSSVCVAHWIADPSRRYDPDDGTIQREGFDHLDVLAALMSAAIPDLATPATRMFSGHLPKRLRWDNHSTHAKLRGILEAIGNAASLEVDAFFGPDEEGTSGPEAAGRAVPVDGAAAAYEGGDFTIPRLPFNRPINRGKIERKLGFLKDLCGEFPSHIDRVIPMDRLKEAPKVERDVSAGTKRRVARREPLPIEWLPTIEECRAMLDGRIDYYNRRHLSRMTGVPRSAVYVQQLPRHVRKGTDLLKALPTHSTFVTGEGICHYHDGVVSRFSAHVDGRFMLAVDTQIVYKLDPLHRLLFLSMDGHLYTIRPLHVYASGDDQARLVAQMQVSAARMHAAATHSVRDAQTDAAFGIGAAAAHREQARALLAARAAVPGGGSGSGGANGSDMDAEAVGTTSGAASLGADTGALPVAPSSRATTPATGTDGLPAAAPRTRRDALKPRKGDTP